MTALLQAALRLAGKGLPVFPCGDKKVPAIAKDEGGNGFHDASTDPAIVRRLFIHPRAALIGVPTGAASGFDVLDADPRHGSDSWTEEHGPTLPRTRTHQTKSGGCHRLFKARPDVRNTESRIAPGIDTRGEGGFIVWWPAAGCEVLDRSSLAPWPEWLIPLLQPPVRPPAAPRDPSAVPDATAAQRMVARALDRVAAAPPGQRHYALRAASCTIGGLLDAADLTASGMSRELLAAVQQAGGGEVDANNAARTIDWGMQKGSASPLEPRTPQPVAELSQGQVATRRRLARDSFRLLRYGANGITLMEQVRRLNASLPEPLPASDVTKLTAWCARQHMEKHHAGR